MYTNNRDVISGHYLMSIGHVEKYHNTLLCTSSALIGAYLFKSPLLEWHNGIQSTPRNART